MRGLVLLVLALSIQFNLLGQGGVNVLYTPVDHIEETKIGKKVKIDFRGQQAKKNIIQKARFADTVEVKIHDKSFTIMERKGAGVDYWYFDKEALESPDYEPGHLLRIEDIVLKAIAKDSILFQMNLIFYKGKKKIRLKDQEIRDLWIPKGLIEGIMEKEE